MASKRGKKNMNVMTINTGKLLANKIKEKKLTKTGLEEKLGRTRSSINPLLKRPSIQTYFLWELSEAIGYNFFHEIADALDEKTGHQLESKRSAENLKLEDLKKENIALREERDYLKKMIDILAK